MNNSMVLIGLVLVGCGSTSVRQVTEVEILGACETVADCDCLDRETVACTNGVCHCTRETVREVPLYEACNGTDDDGDEAVDEQMFRQTEPVPMVSLPEPTDTTLTHVLWNGDGFAVVLYERDLGIDEGGLQTTTADRIELVITSPRGEVLRRNVIAEASHPDFTSPLGFTYIGGAEIGYALVTHSGRIPDVMDVWEGTDVHVYMLTNDGYVRYEATYFDHNPRNSRGAPYMLPFWDHADGGELKVFTTEVRESGLVAMLKRFNGNAVEIVSTDLALVTYRYLMSAAHTTEGYVFSWEQPDVTGPDEHEVRIAPVHNDVLGDTTVSWPWRIPMADPSVGRFATLPGAPTSPLGDRVLYVRMVPLAFSGNRRVEVATLGADGTLLKDFEIWPVAPITYNASGSELVGIFEGQLFRLGLEGETLESHRMRVLPISHAWSSTVIATPDAYAVFGHTFMSWHDDFTRTDTVWLSYFGCSRE